MTLNVTDPEMAFPYSGGRLRLDFVATFGMRYTARSEWLPDGDALAGWINEAGLSDHAGRFRHHGR